MEKSKYFEVYVKDLYQGTKRLQEQIMQNLIKFRQISPQSLPKMHRIEKIMKSLESKQQAMYQRFKDLQQLIKQKEVMAETKETLK